MPATPSKYLAGASQEGAKPITELVMAGLDFAGHAQADIQSGGLGRSQVREILREEHQAQVDTASSRGQLVGGWGTGFGAQDMSGPPYSLSTYSNDWDYASRRNGPPRVWFAKNAKIYGIGCGTAVRLGTGWASIMRQGVTVYGTTEVAAGGRLGFRFPSTNWLSTLPAVISQLPWRRFNGTQ